MPRPVEPEVVLLPTAEDNAKAAKLRYEGRLRMLDAAGLDEFELKAAKERAKQQYLREIDEVV